VRPEREEPDLRNGILEPLSGEQWDDGNTLGGDGCSATCRAEFCGDDIVNARLLGSLMRCSDAGGLCGAFPLRTVPDRLIRRPSVVAAARPGDRHTPSASGGSPSLASRTRHGPSLLDPDL